MKVLAISDLHGSLEAATIIEQIIVRHKIDIILCLGDILYHGPRNDLPLDYNPKKIIPILNNYKDKIISVRGNCDSEVDQMVLEFPILSDINTFYINKRKIVASHGHVYGLDNLPFLSDNDVFIFGHIHIPIAKKENNYYILNPGSSSLPKENHPKTYGVLDDKGFKIYTFNHEVYREINFD
ncbi:MAG: phosphodiesterase [Erysipelotrichaceae bacterium]|nr:phosphodiesterase [Erysipelotrichaceae bacterium]